MGGENLAFMEELRTLGLECFKIPGTGRFINLMGSGKEGLYLRMQARRYSIFRQEVFLNRFVCQIVFCILNHRESREYRAQLVGGGGTGGSSTSFVAMVDPIQNSVKFSYE